MQEVVGEHEFLDIEGGLTLHVGGAGEPDHVVVEETQPQGRPGGGHQKPVIDPDIFDKMLLRFRLDNWTWIPHLGSLSSVMMKSYLLTSPSSD